MSSSPTRLDLLVDIGEIQGQPARVLSTITPPQLVEAILQEFRELEYLSIDPAEYLLAKAEDGSPLDETMPIGQQKLGKDGHVILLERELPVPADARKLARRVYLREQGSGKVYRLHWQPAIVGRRTESQSHKDWVAVDLQHLPTGLRASRRHVMITEDKGQLYVENLAKNPAVILRNRDQRIPIDAQQELLLPEDTILLERSQIMLKVIVRDAAVEPSAVPAPETDSVA